MTRYFTSDHHWGHVAARSFYRRPFSSLAEMDQQNDQSLEFGDPTCG
jgi:hypothetical protein